MSLLSIKNLVMAESNLHDFSSTGLPFSKNCNDLIIIIYALKFRVQCSSEKAKITVYLLH